VNSGEYNPLSLDEGLDHLHSRGARRQDTEDSDYGGIGQVGLTRTLTGRLAAPEDDTPEDGVDVEAELEMNMEIETQLELSAAVMVEKWDFGSHRQQKKQDRKVRNLFCGCVCQLVWAANHWLVLSESMG
jgi:hypothetical protein